MIELVQIENGCHYHQSVKSVDDPRARRTAGPVCPRVRSLCSLTASAFQPLRTPLFSGLSRARASEQLQSSFRAIQFAREFNSRAIKFQTAVSEQIQSSFGAVSEQFRSSFGAVLEQFQSSFRAVSERFLSDFRANEISGQF